jgi:septal ring factor EnvC (AmiA/AmiB activator)
MFGFFKKKFSVLSAESIRPVSVHLSASDATAFYKLYMVQVGFVDKDEIGEHARSLAHEMRQHEAFLKSDIADFKNEIKEAKRQIATFRKAQLKAASPTEQQSLASDILDCEADIANAEVKLAEFEADLNKFRENKRTYLHDYINKQIHGHDWEAT